METKTLKTLADIRRDTGLTQAQVARAMGVDQAQVSRVEASYPNVMFTVLQAYFLALGGRIWFDIGDQVETESSDVTTDPTRTKTVEGRRNDPTRRPQVR